VLKLLADPDVAMRAGTAYRALELRGVRLRRPLARKKVEGFARAATRSIEVEDIRKDDGELELLVWEFFESFLFHLGWMKMENRSTSLVRYTQSALAYQTTGVTEEIVSEAGHFSISTSNSQNVKIMRFPYLFIFSF